MEKLKSNLVTVAVIFFIIAILMPIFILVLYVVPYPDSINGIMRVDNIGSTADFLAGTMTPFLTIAAFFLLLKGYFMQKEELAHTREEMKRSAEALDQQRQIMEDEKNITKKKNELDTFFVLFEHWKNNVLSIKYKIYFLVNYNYRKQSYETKSNMDKIRGNSYFSYLGVNEYGKHLYGLVKISKPVGDFGMVKALNNGSGEKEYQYVIENLNKNSEPLFQGLNNIMDFIQSCNKDNKKIMYGTITHSLSWDEKFILNMIADTFILGKIKDNEVERSKLKDNLIKLNLLKL